MPLISAFNGGDFPVHEVDLDQTLQTRDELLQQLKQNLDMAINRMKQTADAKRREVHFEVGYTASSPSLNVHIKNLLVSTMDLFKSLRSWVQ